MSVTLNDIAKKVGVSPSTVQRALSGVDGVSKKKREEIRLLAQQMGYKRNLVASSLKIGAKKIALILPEPIHNNRYYARYLWEGAKQGASDCAEFNIDILEYAYVRTPESHSAKLREVFERHGNELDGILTMGNSDALSACVFAKMREANIPVVFVGTDGQPNDRLCCVRTYDEMAGRMVADLLINFSTAEKYSRIIITGDFTIEDQFYNAQGFEKHILENHFPLEILKTSSSMILDEVKDEIKQVLNSGLEICAIYSTSARNTVPMCQAVLESQYPNKIRTIGSDIFPESIELITNNQLNAIIHKRPSIQSYQAMQALINFVVKDEALALDSILVDASIVMKSNLECFL